jgi:molecular chaperone GrpE
MTTARKPGATPGDVVDEEQRGKGPDEAAAEGSAVGALYSHSEHKDPIDADLDALVADVQRERDEYLELAQRARADFENYRKRAARDVSDAERRGKAGIARELVPVIDNLERALAAAPEDDPLRKGVELVHAELTSVLERAGVESYDPTGEPFDPSLHEALATRPADDAESGTVIETLERGYRLDGQLIRAARVVVAE